MGFGIRIVSKFSKTHLLNSKLMLLKKLELIYLNPWDGCQMWIGYSLLLLLLNLHYSTIFISFAQKNTICYSLVSLLFWLSKNFFFTTLICISS
jgi:hypothetical protein